MPRSRAEGATPSDSTSARAWFVRPRTKPSGSSSQRQSRPKPPGACAMRPISSGRHGSSKQQAWSAATAERSPSRISAIDAAAIAGGSPTRGISSGGPGLGPRPGLTQIKRSHGRATPPSASASASARAAAQRTSTRASGVGAPLAGRASIAGANAASATSCPVPTTTSGLPFPAATKSGNASAASACGGQSARSERSKSWA